jgi:hypothetical protein
MPTLELEFDGDVIEWRGPSPFHFVAVPEDDATIIAEVAPVVSYGWGVIPATVRIADIDYRTSLFPKNGGYLVPVKDVVRKGARLSIGDHVTVLLTIDMSKA